MKPFLTSLAIISFSLCSLAYAHAERFRSSRGRIIRYGAFAGAGYADWMGRDANGSLPGVAAVAKPGFAAGLLTILDVSRLKSLSVEPFRLAGQLELAYATKGTRFERDGVYRGVQESMTYLQAGLLLRAEYATAGKVTPYVVLGPELGYLYSAQFETGLGNTINGKDDFKSTDIGLILGVGTMFEVPPYGALGLELRGDLGLVSIDGQGDGDEIRNAALTLLLVYLY